MGASHLEHATLSPPSLARGPCLLTVYGRPLTKRVDTGPSCKELGFFKIQLFHI